ncbi:MAG: DUF4838 domain-containing protein [Candidatus Nealsonbacteria bacterium]
MRKFLLIFPALAISFFVFTSLTQAAFPGWDNLSYIYYDDPANNFLQQAADELKNSLGQAGKTLTITNSSPPAPAIYLRVDASLPEFSSRGEEAFKLSSDSDGVYITGKTAIAARHGAYAFLEKLGFRWFFKSPAWNVVPSTLIDLTLDEVQEPFYFFRQIGQSPQVSTGAGNTSDWIARNRLLGAKYYFNGETYLYIVPKTEYSVHPEYFLPEGGAPTWPWQLKPDHPDVVVRAKAYARNLLSAATNPWSSLPLGAVSIIPNDGGLLGWNPPYSSLQTITDLAYTLANEVAKDIKTDFPGRYITMYSYSSHSCIPSFNLESNLIAIITTTYMDCGVSVDDQITGLGAKGATLGIYDYFDVWEWWKDKPVLKLDRVQALTSLAQKGVKYFYTEAGDAWGSKGLTYYAASKMLWNPFQDFNAILTDFYDKAFSPAKVPMKRYYERTGSTLEVVGQNFDDLVQAESLAASNPQILERIRQLEYYQRFLWFYHARGLANLSLDELKSFYTFVTKIRDLYLVTYDCYGGCVGPTIKTELKNRGLTDAQITALQNFTSPTEAEAAIWLDEAKVAFGITSVVDVLPPDRSNGQPSSFLLWDTTQTTISLATNENATCKYGTTANLNFASLSNTFSTTGGMSHSSVVSGLLPGYSYTYYVRCRDAVGNYNDNDYLISFSVASPPAGSCDADPASCLTQGLVGYWPFDAQYTTSTAGTRGLSISGNLWGTFNNGITTAGGISDQGLSFDGIDDNITNMTIPALGLSKNTGTISFWMNARSVSGTNKFLIYSIGSGIQRIYFEIPVSTSYIGFYLSDPQQKIGSYPIQTNTWYFVSGTWNGTSASFYVNGHWVATTAFTGLTSVPSTISVILDNSSCSPFNGLMDELRIYNRVLSPTEILYQYNNPGAPTPPVYVAGDLNKDGKVNLFDISILLSKWGSIVSADLQECDINAGPSNISQGKIDLYDANLLMRNWQP